MPTLRRLFYLQTKHTDITHLRWPRFQIPRNSWSPCVADETLLPICAHHTTAWWIFMGVPSGHQMGPLESPILNGSFDLWNFPWLPGHNRSSPPGLVYSLEIARGQPAEVAEELFKVAWVGPLSELGKPWAAPVENMGNLKKSGQILTTEACSPEPWNHGLLIRGIIPKWPNISG